MELGKLGEEISKFFIKIRKITNISFLFNFFLSS